MNGNESDPLSWAPIGRLVGLQVQPPQSDCEAEVLLEVHADHHNPMGKVHGGVITLLADAAMGVAFGRTLVNQAQFATVELKTNFIRPIKFGTLRAKAVVVQRGIRIGFVECKITDGKGRLIATATCTCSVA